MSGELDKSAKALTVLLNRVAQGEEVAFSHLVERAYDDLHSVAAARLRAQYGARIEQMTVQPTALTNDVLMRLRNQRNSFKNTEHFFAIATRLMLQLIADEARTRLAQKRGGGWQRREMDGQDLAETPGFEAPRADESGELAKMVESLHHADPRAAEIAVLHIFCGHTLEVIAVALDLSLATVKRDWRTAKAWLASYGGPSERE